MEIRNHFTVPLALDQAWNVLLDIPRIAPCMPGARLLSTDEDRKSHTGEVQVRLGPILLGFRGRATIVGMDADARRAVVQAEGRDTKGRGAAKADIAFGLVPEGSGTRVEITTALTLSGSVAQYGRSAGMINDLATQIIGQFAANLRKEIAASEVATSTPQQSAASPAGAMKPMPPETASSNAGGAGQARPAIAPKETTPISGFRLGLWLMWRQLCRLFGRSETGAGRHGRMLD